MLRKVQYFLLSILIILVEKEFRTGVKSEPLVNLTCNEERNNLIEHKSGPANVLQCCSQYFFCVCANRLCKTKEYINTQWCIIFKNQPCEIQSSYRDSCQPADKVCGSLAESRSSSFIILLAIVGALLGLVILVIICIVGYKKFGKEKKGGKIYYGITPNPNVASAVVVSKNKTMPFKRGSFKESTNKTISNLSNSKASSNRTSTSRASSKPKSSNRNSKTGKISRSALERAVM